MAQKTYSFPLVGGLDLTTPAAKIQPGMVISSKNYEPDDEGGYRRVSGYERFDGLPSPTGASYWILNFDAGDIATAEVGGNCRGMTSGAVGVVAVVTLTSGSWAGSDAAGESVLREVVGDFQDNETLSFTGSGDEFTYEYSNEYA